MEYGILDEDWDYISLQQVSGKSGLYETYNPYLPNLIKYVEGLATNTEMKLMLHQTWAYASNSTHADFRITETTRLPCIRQSSQQWTEQPLTMG